MSKEKVILSFVAVTVGLIVAAVAFYFYQGTKEIPKELQKPISILNPNSTPKPAVTLVIDEPKDESVSNTRVIKVSGKTDPDAMIIVLTDTDESVLNPTITGEFSTTVTIETGANPIQITAIGKNGETNTIERTITYSTESF
ncbi:MAG TPA: hypothetical protein VKC89_03665 [Patescibacteria group bacterium]|nr:hypothetical protein [Patescibacteria group bacterium]